MKAARSAVNAPVTAAEPLTLCLPLPPNRANARGHWWKQHRQKKDYFYTLDLRVMLRKLPGAPEVPWERAELAAHLYVHNRYDDDNAVSLCKFPIDWLVSRGYLVDDKRAHLRLAGIPWQTIDRDDPRMVLTLTPMED